MSAPEAAPGLPRTTPAARHAAASNPTARPQRLFFNGHKTGLPGGPREADPATSAPSAPVGVLPTAQPAPPTPQAMGPAAGTGGTRVWGVRVPARAHAWWRDIGRGARGRRSRKTNARADPEADAACGSNALKTSVSRGPHVGEQEKKALFFDKPAHEASSKLLIQLRRWDLGQIRTTRALARCSGNIHGSQEPRVQPRRRIGRCADELGSRR